MVPVPACGNRHVALVRRQGEKECHRLAQVLSSQLRDVQLGGIAGRLQGDVSGQAAFHGSEYGRDLGRISLDVQTAQSIDGLFP